ncbi:hypothetical protein [Herbihabitans rhizosphaerae]|uniref:hypothetical protein n=1 Tax=Herbihabitans rhizosphaerae TaxID=1872711 RepID=UPI001A928FE7|nr:hypothetical protein [Herbihabitans rhizosphaerae]
MTTGEDNWMAVLCGVEWGPIDVTLELHDVGPDELEAGWEIVSERSLYVTSTIVDWMSTDGQLFKAISLATPGWHRVRVHATGRQSRKPKRHTDDGKEEHKIMIWPTSGPSGMQLLLGPDDYGRSAYPGMFDRQ